jgi:hypothetical protein
MDFEHRGLERFGGSNKAVQTRMDGGWGTILESFKAVADGCTAQSRSKRTALTCAKRMGD